MKRVPVDIVFEIPANLEVAIIRAAREIPQRAENMANFYGDDDLRDAVHTLLSQLIDADESHPLYAVLYSITTGRSGYVRKTRR